MSGSSQLVLPTSTSLHRLLNMPGALLDTTMDQLRTLLTVHETR